MSLLKAVLVDDEQLARDEMGYLLDQIGGVDVIGQAGNGVEALTTIDRLQPDVVFLDVQMPGLTGFEVARRLIGNRAASQIIFVTAYDQHAIEAFEVNAVDYLLKPVDQARLEVAVDRARRRIASDRPADGGGHGGVLPFDGAPEDLVQLEVVDLVVFGEVHLRGAFRSIGKRRVPDVQVDPRGFEAEYRAALTHVLTEARLTVPADQRAIVGGRRGHHSEHLGHLLATMQYLPRAYPGATW